MTSPILGIVSEFFHRLLSKNSNKEKDTAFAVSNSRSRNAASSMSAETVSSISKRTRATHTWAHFGEDRKVATRSLRDYGTRSAAPSLHLLPLRTFPHQLTLYSGCARLSFFKG